MSHGNLRVIYPPPDSQGVINMEEKPIWVVVQYTTRPTRGLRGMAIRDFTGSSGISARASFHDAKAQAYIFLFDKLEPGNYSLLFSDCYPGAGESLKMHLVSQAKELERGEPYVDAVSIGWPLNGSTALSQTVFVSGSATVDDAANVTVQITCQTDPANHFYGSSGTLGASGFWFTSVYVNDPHVGAAPNTDYVIQASDSLGNPAIPVTIKIQPL